MRVGHRTPRSKFGIGVLTFALVAGAALFCVGCSRAVKESERTHDAVEGVKPITTADLKQLRWIEGAWRGTGDVEKPFFERYHFDGDSALVVESFDDESLSKVTEVTRFELKDGKFGNWGEGSRWVATRLGEDSVTFEPTAKAKNSFRWQRESADVWKAVLDYPASDGKPARQRVYRMERLSQPNH